MKIYIRAASNISPQQTFKQVTFPFQAVEYTGNILNAIEPDYKDIIDGKTIRRMSRIVKMGVAAALECLKDAGEENPGAIITGTAYGCLADTNNFLSGMVEQSEGLLSPTAFIQSTHNTVGAQIALILQCNSYNNTFVNGGFSFENVLLDAMMLLHEEEATNVLAGSIDELIGLSHDVLRRFRLYKRVPISNFDLLASASKGTIAGEGAAFFLLSSHPSPDDLARLEGVATFYKPKDTAEIGNNIVAFLADHGLKITDIDLVIAGKNGDVKNDAYYDLLKGMIFIKNEMIHYKHLCGDYPTAVSFAVWLAAYIIKTGRVPAGAGYEVSSENKLRRILICNNYQKLHHSLVLISA
jgi:3-oxoacyl-[acyl-carrier-protein] synthase II